MGNVAIWKQHENIFPKYSSVFSQIVDEIEIEEKRMYGMVLNGNTNRRRRRRHTNEPTARSNKMETTC